MTNDAIIEAAARALAECGFYDNEATAAARTMLAAVTPLIRSAALEEAAKVADACDLREFTAQDSLVQDIVAAIRALKEQP